MHQTRLLSLLLLAGLPLGACGLGDGLEAYYGDTEGGPSIDALSTYSVPGTTGGQVITIQGSNFGSDPQAITVVFGDQNAEVLSIDGNSMSVRLPRGPLQGGAVRVAVGTLEGQAVYDASFEYQGSASDIDEQAYIHVSNDYFSCLAGLGASGTILNEDGEEEQVASFCNSFAYTGVTGLSGRGEFLNFAFPRLHTIFVGDKAGFAGAADQSWGAWTVMAPAQEFNEFDIQGLYENRRLDVGSFTLVNPDLEGETFCLDETILSAYTYSGGDKDDEGEVYPPFKVYGEGLLNQSAADCDAVGTKLLEADRVGFCKTPEYADAHNYQYDASWAAGSYFFADRTDWRDVNPRELGNPTVKLDIPGNGSGFVVDDLNLTLPSYAFFDAIQGSLPEVNFEGSSGLFYKDDTCFDGDGDGKVGRLDPAYTFAWRPATPYLNEDGEFELPEGADPRIKNVRYYVQANVSVLAAGWLGGEGVSVRAVITVPDRNHYDQISGYSTLELPNWVWYSLPSTFQDYGVGGVGIVTWGDPYRSDYGQLFLTLDQVAEYEIDVGADEFGNPRSMVFSYSTGNMGLQPAFGGDDTINPLDKGQCGDCDDGDGDGWIDAADPDCSRSPYEETGYDNRFTCNDGRDNDRDGLIDSEDPDCVRATDREDPPVPDCTDGDDNDADGWTDEADPDCATDPETSFETGFDAALPCNDDADNDADGWVDAIDPDCTDANAEELGVGTGGCNDGIDNDLDGDIDAADSECTAPSDIELGFGLTGCFDGIDNDSDGWVDDADPDCAGDPTADELGLGTTACNDGVDNDGNGDVDSADPDCVDAADDSEE